MKKTLGIVILAAIGLALTGCGAIGNGIKEGIKEIKEISNDDNWNQGGGEVSEKITDLEIEWSSGEVNVFVSEGENIIISESSNEKEPLTRWIVENGKLIIKNRNSSWISLGNNASVLSVSIPKNNSFNKISVGTASGNINIGDLTADRMEISTASGKIDAINLVSEKMDISSASGKISAKSISVKDIDISSASGKIDYDGIKQSDYVEISSASGKVNASFGEMPKELNVDTASGDVTVALPEKSDFTATFDTASGDMISEIPVKNYDKSMVAGNGNNQMYINTASGDFKLQIR